MIIEAITFKLALDFAKYLHKNRIYLANVKIDFFDRTLHEYLDFGNLDAMELYYNENYVPLNNCELGTLAGIQFFNSASDTYNFQTTYKAVDVIGKLNLIQGSGFDIQRNNQRTVLKQRQLDFVNKTIQEYLNFYNQLKFIYITGIYSPCYAEPGWSENTWWLKTLRDSLVTSTNQSKFPYKNAIIEINPPIMAAHTTPPSVYR